MLDDSGIILKIIATESVFCAKMHRARAKPGGRKTRTYDSHSPLPAREGSNVDEAAQKVNRSFQKSRPKGHSPAVVEHPLLSTALRHLLLLLLFDLGGLRLDLAGTGERAVNYNLAIAAIAKRANSKYS